MKPVPSHPRHTQTAVSGTFAPMYSSSTAGFSLAIDLSIDLFDFLNRSTVVISNLRGGRRIVAYPTFRLPLGSIAGPIRYHITLLTFSSIFLVVSLCSNHSLSTLCYLLGFPTSLTPAFFLVADRKFNGYQIGAFPEIRLTAPSPAPTSVQVDPLRTSDSPAERSACRRTSPPGSLSLNPSSPSHCEIHIS
ncbi:hypothetical protein N7457_003922 [Penicillium paradoxum]|uniref:uncharacterized protein n=1 Tax=Penicillium paradoxum TaxID=176176 RepID=UPI0025480BD5|nr:uncharacterized protein N7457_003922 [Penicillium paradoxum]KAJ5782148.1 hypothetical protein N7457_003922 [Penicillium paradoxum]